RIVSGSYSRPIGRAASLFLSGDYDLEGKAGSVQLRLVLPFGRNLVTGGLSQDRYRGVVTPLGYIPSIPTEGGFGFDASLAVDEDGRSYGQGTATWRGRAIELQTGTAFARGNQTVWGSATGSVVAMAGGVFTARSIADSFAVVSTDGVDGV